MDSLIRPRLFEAALAVVYSEIRARAGLVRARTALVNSARGVAKSYGERLRRCGTQQVGRDLAMGLSAELRAALEPLLLEIESLNEHIKEYDRRIEKMAKEAYPEVALLKQVKGVGDLIALAGCFVGLQSGRRNSGQSEPQMHISKEGDRYLRTLLVQGTHYILGPFGEDSDLRRWGKKLAERGGGGNRNAEDGREFLPSFSTDRRDG